MSLNKAIASGKERRKPYYNTGRYDEGCRPHGGCTYCLNNRFYSEAKRKQSADEQIKAWKDGEFNE